MSQDPKTALPVGLRGFYALLTEMFRAPLIGWMVGCVLSGVILGQTISYYRTYPKDGRNIKILVGTLCLLEFAHLGGLTQAAWVYFIRAKMPENVNLLFRAPIGFSVAFLLSIIMTSLVQAFYAWRVWLVSNSHHYRDYVVGTILALNLMSFVFGIVTNVPQYGKESISGAHAPTRAAFFSAQLATSMLCDLVISVSLVYFLRRARSPFRSSRNVVDRLVISSVNVGLLTTAMAIATFIVFHACRGGFEFVALVDIISKVYVNSLLVTLNSRKELRQAFDGPKSNHFRLVDLDKSVSNGIQVTKVTESCLST